jgi:hypothetical protein
VGWGTGLGSDHQEASTSGIGDKATPKSSARPFEAVTDQSIGCLDPFPLLLRLDRVLRTDFIKLPRLRRILSVL